MKLSLHVLITCLFVTTFTNFELFAGGVPLTAVSSPADGGKDQILTEAQRVVKIQYQADKVSAIFGGKSYLEQFGGANLNFLNSEVGTDFSSFLRTTNDFYVSVAYGDSFIRPRVSFHNTFRFRFNWGAQTLVNSSQGSLALASATLPVAGTSIDKHLVWSREAWVKFMLGNLDYPNNNFVQLGLINYEIGRGISLGSAYNNDGFLGFAPGFSIDQFAPAVLLSLNPIVERYTIDFYAAFLENNNTKFKLNDQSIRGQELYNTCSKRGPGRQAYIIALNNHVKVLNGVKQKLTIEPYVIYQTAPDQMLEFPADSDNFVTTFGCCVEADHGRFNWGFEFARNIGETNIKPWDRNTIQVTTNTQGFLVQQYTYVYSANPDTPNNPGKNIVPANLAYVTPATVAAVSGSFYDPSMNGKQIVESVFSGINNDPAPVSPAFPACGDELVNQCLPLYNAYDRFRPRQSQELCGYFGVADVSYKAIENVLTVSSGVGYASGYINPQSDTNQMTSEQLMHQKFTGFIPLQSTYQGKRIKHMVIFNQGIPRFIFKNPNLSNAQQNLIDITPTLQSDDINEMFNIAFFGGSADWKVAKWRSHSVEMSMHVIGYWSPEVPGYGLNSTTTSIGLKDADTFMGTEWTTELEAMFYKKLKLYGYFGVFFPGTLYKNMCGTSSDVTKSSSYTYGSDMAYVCNIGLSYMF